MLLQLLTHLQTFAASACPGTTFFGLRPWYYYLDYGKITLSNGGYYCGVKGGFEVLPRSGTSDLLLVGLVVIDDMIRLGGLVAVGFIIYGAFQYVTSQGNPEQASKAQSTIQNAVIGLVVVIIAVSLISFLGTNIGK